MIVPFFLLPLAFTGAVDAHMVVPFAVLDPVLGLGALLVWLRTRDRDPAAPSAVDEFSVG